MIDESQEEQIERWVKFIIENPNKWKAEHTKFIDAQFLKSKEFFERLSRTKEGLIILNKLKESRLISK